ncbi:MAG: UDP-N-acetylmuramoyl-tripeptide--D-alanyl-D-alanine ligase [Candidatus Moranbacteria bacterium]|nr:UDP-N-acetylmuramoyl-tripeptide--D-alanyl-D-alanine ligase [Candidatus Moranbacteria bacterium]
MAEVEEKSGKRKVAERLLAFMAGAVIRKYHPLIIGVTGSVGKSSTKEATALVLSAESRVRKNEGNFNNEIGLPFTVIGVGTGGDVTTRFFSAAVRFVWLMVMPSRYPEALVLEMGVDRPGDMAALLSFAPAKIGILTTIGESHLEYFGSVGAIAKEKGRLIASLPADGFAILNADDRRIAKMVGKTKAVPITYGFGPEAMVRADNITLQETDGNVGSSFKLNYQGKTIPVRLPGVIARHHIADALAGAAAGIAVGMNLVEIAGALEGFLPLPGRLRFIQGRGGSGLLDDTYNSSPASLRAALETLREVTARRKVVMLGDMLELGSVSEEEHRGLAVDIRSAGTELAVLVGRRMRSLGEELIAHGMPRGQVFLLPDPDSAALAAPDLVGEGDLVLIKGSQGLRMEKVTEALLRDPKDAAALLCRQSTVWRKKPFSPPIEWDETAI